MPLAPGRRLGPYEVVSPLGAGGMGEVYEARDTRLGRTVAVKVLPEELAQDEDRRTRFEREARAVSQLSHPCVCTLHDVGEEDGVHFLVMERCHGETLTERLERGPLPLSEALEVSRQVALGLEAAHAKGIIHRDLKPGNVMLGPKGAVKILDFGLAKALELREATDQDLTRSPTLTIQAATERGMILGTGPYLSPEQARGQEVDERTDVWAFGCFLYEMLTGRRAFDGATLTDTVAAVVHQEPDWEALPEETPGMVRWLLRCCLEKDLDQRLQAMTDVRLALEGTEEVAIAERAQREMEATAVPAAAAGSRIAWAVTVVLLVVAAAAVLWGWRAVQREAGGHGEPLTATFSQLTQEAGRELQPTLSPDGKFVAYASDAGGSWDVHLLRIGGRNPINLTADSRTDDRQPAFSPDGSRIAFRSERDGGGIFLMGATGEAVRRLTDFGYNPAWSPDGEALVVATESVGGFPYTAFGTSELRVVDVDSGEVKTIYEGDARQPSWSPGGKRIAYWGWRGGRVLSTIAADGSDPVPVTEDQYLDWSPAWSPEGHHLYFASDRSGSLNLWRVAIDEATGEVLGPPEPISAPSQWAGELSFSREDTRMVFSSQSRNANIGQVAFDPDSGRIEGATASVTKLSMPVREPSLSPDGGRLLFCTVLPQRDLYSIGTDGTDLRRITDHAHRPVGGPSWAPDGKHIYFHSTRDGVGQIWRIRPDGSGAEQITRLDDSWLSYPTPSPDGSRLTAFHVGGTILMDLTGPLPETEPPHLPNPTPGTVFHGTNWSPDGRLLAGVGHGSAGRLDPALDVLLFDVESETFRHVGTVQGDPRGEERFTWLPDGRELIVSADGMLKLLDIESGETRLLLEPAPGSQLGTPMLSPDGRSLYFLEENEESNIWMMSLARPAADL